MFADHIFLLSKSEVNKFGYDVTVWQIDSDQAHKYGSYSLFNNKDRVEDAPNFIQNMEYRIGARDTETIARMLNEELDRYEYDADPGIYLSLDQMTTLQSTLATLDLVGEYSPRMFTSDFEQVYEELHNEELHNEDTPQLEHEVFLEAVDRLNATSPDNHYWDVQEGMLFLVKIIPDDYHELEELLEQGYEVDQEVVIRIFEEQLDLYKYARYILRSERTDSSSYDTTIPDPGSSIAMSSSFTSASPIDANIAILRGTASGDYATCSSINIANYRTIFEEHRSAVYDVYGGYGYSAIAVSISLLCGNTESSRAIRAALFEMSEYIILDEETLSKVEHELQEEALDLWLVGEITSGLVNKFNYVDYLYDEEDAIRDLIYSKIEELNLEWISETTSMTLYKWEDIVTSTELRELPLPPRS